MRCLVCMVSSIEGGRAMNSPVVLITGALTGIGRAAAFIFAQDGAQVVVAGRRDDQGQALVELTNSSSLVSTGGTIAVTSSDAKITLDNHSNWTNAGPLVVGQNSGSSGLMQLTNSSNATNHAATVGNLAGAQVKVKAFGIRVALIYGKDLRTGNNAIFVTLLNQ